MLGIGKWHLEHKFTQNVIIPSVLIAFKQTNKHCVMKQTNNTVLRNKQTNITLLHIISENQL